MNRTLRIRLPDDGVLMDTLFEFSRSAQEAVDVGWGKESNRFRLHHLVYKDIRGWSRLNAQLVVASIGKASEAIKSTVKRHGKKPVFKELLPVRFDERSYWVRLGDGECSLSTIEGRKRYDFTLPDYYSKFVDWTPRSADLCCDRRGRLWLHVVVAKEADAVSLSKRRTIHHRGVDLGINNLAVTSDQQFFNGVSDRLLRLQRLRGRLQSKGTKSAKRHLKKVAGRQRRLMRDVNHVVSKQIVGGLEAGDVVVVEDLKGIRAQKSKGRRLNRLIHGWAYAQLQSFIAYKAEERGVDFVVVSARDTSKTCSRCGGKATLRPKKAGFLHCLDCGYKSNADFNAALNIRARADPCGNGFGAVVSQPIAASSGFHLSCKPYPSG